MHAQLRKPVRAANDALEKLMETMELLNAVTNAKEQSRKRLLSDQQSMSRETIKHLSFAAVRKFNPLTQVFLVWIARFKEDTRGLDNDTLLLKKLKEGLVNDKEKTILLRRYRGDEYAEAVQELNSKFGDHRLAWYEAAKAMDSCKSLAVTLDDVRQVLLISVSIFDNVKDYESLAIYATEDWWLASVFPRLPKDLKVQFCKDN